MAVALQASPEGLQDKESRCLLDDAEAGAQLAGAKLMGTAARKHHGVEDAQSDPSTELGSEGTLEGDDSSASDDEEDALAFRLQDTILIFDWDDTMLPSTWIQEQGLRLDDDSMPTEEQKAQLDAMALRAAETLRIAKRHGKVLLVTNAEKGWIELSCRKFMPSLCSSLEHVRIQSARSTYECRGVSSPFEWKYYAFESEIGQFFEFCSAERRKNVISFGDSAHEREALIRVTERMENCLTKSLKFVERPDVEQLLKEHQLISGCFRDVVNYDGSLDLCIRCP
eukprot:TRINITY_DN38521_c0_g1_i1.p1 TRINITY_DN38521_c0_g1~~TRINITY_DN38521_c0_g1_i1.p1  ORF type:complete len:283 (+),score=57.78 TRINITY_DN38521_c0_g1_i1:97-945(+)